MVIGCEIAKKKKNGWIYKKGLMNITDNMRLIRYEKNIVKVMYGMAESHFVKGTIKGIKRKIENQKKEYEKK